MTVQTVRWDGHGGTVDLAPARGRVLQVTLGDENAYWTDAASAGWNVGGDRLWLGPESAWFWKTTHSTDFADHEVPAALDPGAWRFASAGEGWGRVEQEVLLAHRHRPGSVALLLSRTWSLVNADLPGFAAALAYTTTDELHVRSNPDGLHGQPVSLWAMIQVPNGGTLEVPVRRASVARDYFEPAPATHARTHGAVFQLRITGNRRFKIGLAPGEVAGCFAYARPLRDSRMVIHRSFIPRPWLRYCDVPLGDAGQGDAVQAYNDSGQNGGFGEVEHHSPAVTIGRGPQSIVETSLTVVGIVPDDGWEAWRAGWLFGSLPLRARIED